MQAANPINVSHIDHVVIRVNNLETMAAFYTNVLGLRPERGPGNGRLLQLRAGGSLVDLVEAAGPLGRKSGGPPDHANPNMDHLCLQVNPWDSDTIRDHLDKHDVVYGEIAPRYGAAGQGPSLYLKDPEGNNVELKGTHS